MGANQRPNSSGLSIPCRILLASRHSCSCPAVIFPPSSQCLTYSQLVNAFSVRQPRGLTLPETAGEKRPAHEYRGNQNRVNRPTSLTKTPATAKITPWNRLLYRRAAAFPPHNIRVRLGEGGEQKNPHVLDNGYDQLA